MKSLIKRLLKQKLNEVSLSRHSLDRAEERVWGTKQMTNGEINNDPPTMNKEAWADEIKYNKIDVPTSRGERTIPATDSVRDVMSKLNFIQNNLKVDVTLEEDETVNLIIFSSYKEHRGGDIWGTILTGLVARAGNRDSMLTIQWQNTDDLMTLRGGKFGKPKYIVSVENLLKNGISILNDENIVNLALYPRPKKNTPPKVKPQPEKAEKYKKLKLTNGTEVRYYSNSNKFETISGEPLDVDSVYELLTPEMQDIVINALG